MSDPLVLAEKALASLCAGRTDAAREALEALVTALRTSSAASQALPGPPASPPRAAARPASLLPRSSEPVRFIPAFGRAAQELDQHVARLGAERVATVLRITVANLGPMLAGRVEIPPGWLHRLRLEDPNDDAS